MRISIVRGLTLLFGALLLTLSASGQIVINEVSSKNDTTIADQNLNYPDWIELYNTGNASVNLGGYGLSDDSTNAYKWVFGNIDLAAQDHMLVFASGKDINVGQSAVQSISGISTGGGPYSDANEATPGNSSVEPLDFVSIIGQVAGENALSMRFNLSNNGGNGGYAGYYMTFDDNGQPINLSQHNVVKITATIEDGRSFRIRFGGDDIEFWEHPGIKIVGTGIPNDVYEVPLLKVTGKSDLTQMEGIDFAMDLPYGQTDLVVTDVSVERSDAVSISNEVYYAYDDSGQGGNSSTGTFEFPEIYNVTDSGNVFSWTMDYASNTELGFSYVGLGMRTLGWNDAVDISDYQGLRIRGYIEQGRRVTVRFVQTGLEGWLGYGRVIIGTGVHNDIYEIPLVGSVGPLDPTRIETIVFEGQGPFGSTDLTIADIALTTTETSSYLHTNFKLSSDGEKISLYTPQLAKADEVEVLVLQSDMSYGRESDGAPNWVLFDVPTPDTNNALSSGYNGYCSDDLIFSHEAGFYPSAISLSITGSSEIRYTTDGTEPNSGSSLYTQAIDIDSTTVIKASCFSAGSLPESIQVNTYFIGDSHTLPVWSLSTNPDHLFDFNTGIFEFGPNADLEAMPHYGANFWEDWERPLYVEFYDESGVQQFEQGAGIQVFGGWSRSLAAKSMRIKAKSKYGPDRLPYAFFVDKPIDSFKQVVLRNSGNESGFTHFHDALNRELIHEATDLDNLAYQPSIVYINGQYWGVFNIREKINEHYIKDNHDVEGDNLQLIDSWGGAIHGPDNNWWSLHWNITNTDMSVQSNYEQWIDTFDIDNYIDMFAADIYISNWDWPQNNLKFWRKMSGDRKIRYIMFDTDISLGKFGLQSAQFDQLNRILNTADDSHSEIFSSFMQNVGFRDQWINRSADLMNTVYLTENFTDLVYELRDVIAPEMPAHFDRWDQPYGVHDNPPTLAQWPDHVQELVDFGADRLGPARDQIEDQFNLTKQVDVTLDVSPAGAGHIKLNSIIPEDLPWTGVYYDGVPVTLTAVANPGFTFSNWTSSITLSDNQSLGLTLNVDGDHNFTANFTGASSTVDVLVSEVNYHSAVEIQTGDWIEFYNNGTGPVDLTGWILTDGQPGNSFEFPAGSVMNVDGYLVAVEDGELFGAYYSAVDNFVGDLGFSLSNGGESFVLLDRARDTVLTFEYNDEIPWPLEADGLGKTLELDDYAFDNKDPANWFAGCTGGSPGVAYDESCLTGLLSSEEAHGIAIFPNPAHDRCTVLIPDGYNDYEFKLVDALGTVVLQTEDRGKSLSISTGNLKPGVYSARLFTSDTSYSQKLILH